MAELWASPLSGLLFTLCVYQLCAAFYVRSGQRPWLHPVLWSALGISLFLQLGGWSYEEYWNGARFLHFLLGPATVALAIPLFTHWARIKSSGVRLLVITFIGSMCGAFSVLAIATLCGVPSELFPSMVAKSVTTPIAIGITETIGGDPQWVVLCVVLTGIFGAVVGVSWLRIVRVSDPAAIGMALGVAAHGIGTARAIQVDTRCAAYAGIGMGLCGLWSALLLPWVFRWWG